MSLTGLVFSEYLLTGQAPSVKEVNAEEPLFPAAPFLNGISAKPVSWCLLFFCFHIEHAETSTVFKDIQKSTSVQQILFADSQICLYIYTSNARV